MTAEFQRRLDALATRSALDQLRHGIEKESLRVTRSGELAQTRHPEALGSPLTHPNITTDFSEAQIEFVTGVHTSAADCLAELEELHRFVYSKLESELLWPFSMPCFLGGERNVPIARYGTSNAARIKEIHREGLANRYGRLMQTVSGMHYNFSFAEEFWQRYAEIEDVEDSQRWRDACYLRLVRNFRRNCWLLLVLFGASPVMCRSFTRGMAHTLAAFDDASLFLPRATSLRMGPLGYQSAAQANLNITFNSLPEFVRSMARALAEPYPPYVEIGIKDGSTFRQLNTAVLQIEAEYYGPIRLKRKPRPHERSLTALEQRGVEYLEVRCVDIDPFHPIGIDERTCHFLDVFLVYSLICASPPDTELEGAAIIANQHTVVHEGRDPSIELQRMSHFVTLKDWATALFAELELVADLMDSVGNSTSYRDSVARNQLKIDDMTHTPSARILKEMREQQLSFSAYGSEFAERYADQLTDAPLPSARRVHHDRLVRQSLIDHRAIEASQTEPFESYWERYMHVGSQA